MDSPGNSRGRSDGGPPVAGYIDAGGFVLLRYRHRNCPLLINLNSNSTMSAYCFFDVLEVTDAEKMEAYRARVFMTLANHGGRYVILGGPIDVIEGRRVACHGLAKCDARGGLPAG